MRSLRHDTMVAIIVCRMDSARLPGKPLRQVAGRPLLEYVLARCRQVEQLADRIVVATSNRPVDDPLATYALRQGLSVFRGAALDVAGRVLACARQHSADWFFRINGDSPFVDPSLLRRACQMAVDEPLDFITNLQPRTFPYGVAVEAVRTDAFERAYAEMDQPEHFEHVTRYLYEHLDDFRWRNLTNSDSDPHAVKLTVDTPEDLHWFREVIRRYGSRWAELSFQEMVAEPSLARRAA